MSEDRSKFFTFNIGHVITITFYLVTCGVCYGLIKGKVDSLEVRVTMMENIIRNDNPKLQADLNEIKVKLGIIETNLSWLRPNPQPAKAK